MVNRHCLHQPITTLLWTCTARDEATVFPRSDDPQRDVGRMRTEDLLTTKNTCEDTASSLLTIRSGTLDDGEFEPMEPQRVTECDNLQTDDSPCGACLGDGVCHACWYEHWDADPAEASLALLQRVAAVTSSIWESKGH